MPDNTTPQPEAERLIDNLEALKVYFDPMRVRIMQALAGEPRTVHEVATLLNVPFTRLYYQFNLLEKHGFIRVVETRTLSGAVEVKYYQVAACMFTIDRSLLTVSPEGGDDGMEVVFRSVFDETRRDIRQSVQTGLIDMQEIPPHPHALLLKRGIVRLTPEAATRLYQRINELIIEAQTESAAEEGAAYGLLLGLYPSAFFDGTSPTGDE